MAEAAFPLPCDHSRVPGCLLLVGTNYRPYPIRLFRDSILQGQHDLLPLRLASFRAYAANISLMICLQGSILGSWLAIIRMEFAPASLCSIAKPQRALNSNHIIDPISLYFIDLSCKLGELCHQSQNFGGSVGSHLFLG